jgi:hypothetical protein
MSAATCGLIAQVLPVFLLIIAIPTGAIIDAVKGAASVPNLGGQPNPFRLFPSWFMGRFMILLFIVTEGFLVVGANQEQGLTGDWLPVGQIAWAICGLVGLIAAVDLGVSTFPRPPEEPPAP